MSFHKKSVNDFEQTIQQDKNKRQEKNIDDY